MERTSILVAQTRTLTKIPTIISARQQRLPLLQLQRQQRLPFLQQQRQRQRQRQQQRLPCRLCKVCVCVCVCVFPTGHRAFHLSSSPPTVINECNFLQSVLLGCKNEQKAAAALGYTQLIWDNVSGKEKQPASVDKRWAKLTDSEKAAAVVLGYTEKIWDKGGTKDQPASAGKYWAELSSCGVTATTKSGKCPAWCAKHSAPWKEKCTWRNCGPCPVCDGKYAYVFVCVCACDQIEDICKPVVGLLSRGPWANRQSGPGTLNT